MIRTLLAACAALSAFAAPSLAQDAAPQQSAAHQGAYQNFKVAIYVTVGSTRRLADPANFEADFARVSSQLKFDKVYVEAYRDHQFASDEELDSVTRQFRAHGIEVSGGITPAAGGSGGQFGTFDYENPVDMAECQRASQLVARHFDDFILDDFFFYTSKSEADIAARGNRSWTQYRLERMREVSQQCVIGPARAVNPSVRITIKYPNWYEHFQASGFDLEQQPNMFDAIYTGTETRDPEITDQLLQQYESYEIYRYFRNIRPDVREGRSGNGGGWVDTFGTRYVDRYAEQLWLTMLAKAPEITLFNWFPMAQREAVDAGARPWSRRATSFNWNAMRASYSSTAQGDPGPGWARAAGYSLEQIDRVVGALGNPVGIASYRPAHASGEDFLHNYLGNIGLPIELYPNYPTDADTVLLTEAASHDPNIIDKIDASLRAGHRVIVTSGFACAMDRPDGIDRIVEVDCTGRRAAINTFYNGFGAGNGAQLSDAAHPTPPVNFQEIRFFTNDAWGIIRGVANNRGFPILIMNRYANGIIYVLNIPDNPGDLYNLPRGLLTQMRAYVQGDIGGVRLDADAHVSLFAYDNNTFVVQSFRDAPANVTLLVNGEGKSLTELPSGATIAGQLPPQPPAFFGRQPPRPARTDFAISIEPHSYRVFRIN